MFDIKKAPSFRVVWFANGKHDFEYITVGTAQEAVDICRLLFAPEGAEIVEVAKVIKGWK